MTEGFEYLVRLLSQGVTFAYFGLSTLTSSSVVLFVFIFCTKAILKIVNSMWKMKTFIFGRSLTRNHFFSCTTRFPCLFPMPFSLSHDPTKKIKFGEVSFSNKDNGFSPHHCVWFLLFALRPPLHPSRPRPRPPLLLHNLSYTTHHIPVISHN